MPHSIFHDNGGAAKHSTSLVIIVSALALLLAARFIDHKFIRSSDSKPLLIEDTVQETPQAKILSGEKIDINSASVAELEVLPGIGAALAARIVETRTARGGFKAPEEIDLVPGVGKVKYQQIRRFIDVK